MAQDVAPPGNACRPDTASSLRTDRVESRLLREADAATNYSWIGYLAAGSTKGQSVLEHDVGRDEQNADSDGGRDHGRSDALEASARPKASSQSERRRRRADGRCDAPQRGRMNLDGRQHRDSSGHRCDNDAEDVVRKLRGIPRNGPLCPEFSGILSLDAPIVLRPCCRYRVIAHHWRLLGDVRGQPMPRAERDTADREDSSNWCLRRGPHMTTSG